MPEKQKINLFWPKRYTFSEINTFYFSTLYTSLPLHFIKIKLIGLVEKTFDREQTEFILVCKNQYMGLAVARRLDENIHQAVADPGFDLRGGVDFVNGGGGVENH